MNDISVEFNSGRSIGLVGPNGVGKTTLLRILFNLDSNYSGKVFFDDTSNTDFNVFKKVSFMQSQDILYPNLTGYDHLKLVKDAHKLPETTLRMCADKVGISPYINKAVFQYSLGMKQHLLIAMGLLNNPKCIVMDEPFNGLDPTSVYEFKCILNQLRTEHVTLLMSSHNLSIIEELVDDVYFLKDGLLDKIEMKHHQIQQFQLETESGQKEIIEIIFNKENLKYRCDDNIIYVEGNISDYIKVLTNHGIVTVKSIENRMNLEDIYNSTYIS